MHAIWPAHIPLPPLFNNPIICNEEYTVWSSTLSNFSCPLLLLLSYVQTSSHTPPFPNILSLGSSLRVFTPI
jgi:hypothetical protein